MEGLAGMAIGAERVGAGRVVDVGSVAISARGVGDGERDTWLER